MTALTLRARVALALGLCLATPAVGQNAQQPVIITPPVGDFDISPKATPRPTPAPEPATQTAAPTPEARVAAAPRPAASRGATATATPTPAPSASASPARLEPGFTPVGPPDPSASASSGSGARGTAGGEMPGDLLSNWLWLAVAGAVAVLVGLGAGLAIAGRRRRRDPVAPLSDAAPIIAAPPTPGPPARAGGAGRGRAPDPVARGGQAAAQTLAVPAPPGPLVTELRPLRAAIRDGLVLVDFELYIQNRGPEPADNVRAVLALMAANADQDAQIAAFHGAARMAPGSEPFSIAPGGIHMLKGQVAQSGDAMPVVHVQGRPMFVPILPVALKWYAGLSIRTLRDAFMIGTVPAPGSDRLGPLWVERAGEGFGRLAAKRYVPRMPG